MLQRHSILVPTLITLLFAMINCDSSPQNEEDADSSADGDADADGDVEHDSAADGDTGDGGSSATCEAFPNIETFTTVTEKSKTKRDDERDTQRIFYTGGDDGVAYDAYSILKITAYEDFTGFPADSGAVIDLGEIGTNAGDGFLVRIGVDCDEQGRLCNRWFWAYAGEAIVSSIDWTTPDGSTFAGSLTDILFREVTLDENELPVLVAEGCSFTMESFAWEHAVTVAGGGGGGGDH